MTLPHRTKPPKYGQRESWKPVVGWETFYEVSDWGRVRRLSSGRILKPCLAGLGYAQITLSRHGTRKKCLIHGLVLEAFIGPRPAGHEAHHANEDKGDNHLGNLQWVSHRENMAHHICDRGGRWVRKIVAQLPWEQVCRLRQSG